MLTRFRRKPQALDKKIARVLELAQDYEDGSESWSGAEIAADLRAVINLPTNDEWIHMLFLAMASQDEERVKEMLEKAKPQQLLDASGAMAVGANLIYDEISDRSEAAL